MKSRGKLMALLGTGLLMLGISPCSYGLLPMFRLPDWLPKKQMTLGLDLQGGSHILLQIDQQDLINERLVTARDDIRNLLSEARIGYTGLSGAGRYVQVRIRDAEDISRWAFDLASTHCGQKMSDDDERVLDRMLEFVTQAAMRLAALKAETPDSHERSPQ